MTVLSVIAFILRQGLSGGLKKKATRIKRLARRRWGNGWESFCALHWLCCRRSMRSSCGEVIPAPAFGWSGWSSQSFSSYSRSAATDWWSNVPCLVQNVIIALIFIGIVAFGTVEGCIISRMDEHTNPNLNYVTVFGAQVRKSGPSKVLRYRLDTAIDYLNEKSGHHLHRLRWQRAE